MYFYPNDGTRLGQYLADQGIKYLHVSEGPEFTIEGATDQIIASYEAYVRGDLEEFTDSFDNEELSCNIPYQIPDSKIAELDTIIENEYKLVDLIMSVPMNYGDDNLSGKIPACEAGL